MTKWSKVFVLTVLLAMSSAQLMAEPTAYLISMTGDQEAPGAGDPDGSATGTISLDGVTGEIIWDFTYSDILAPTAMHIHGPGGSAGSAASVAIGLGVGTSGPAGTLDGSFIHPTLSDVTAILADPTDYYVNIHNPDFPSGAVRGQLGVPVPEPSGVVLLSLGLLVPMWRHRRGRRDSSGPRRTERPRCHRSSRGPGTAPGRCHH